MLRKNILSFSIALLIMYLSLTGSDTFSGLKIPVIPYLDKIIHAIMYFSLMLALIFENRRIVVSLRSYVVLATIPFFYGVLIEILQTLFTIDRQGDIVDVCFNLAGIILAIFFWRLLKALSGKSSK